MKILVVEDDRAVALSLQLLLNSYHYAVDTAADGEAALQMVDAFEYDLVLLDVLLPKLDGIEVCRHLRKNGFRQPILLLTGQGETQQKTVALNSGADDYVVKPFDTDELVARIQALLRRGGPAGEPILTWGHLSLDPNTRGVSYEAHQLQLTPKEYAILELFLRHQETVFSARAILDRAWSSLEFPAEEAVRSHIKELRQKLTAVGAPRNLIQTIYRVGYRLNSLYASPRTDRVDSQSNASQVAELQSVNDQLRVALAQLQTTQAALQQKNQEMFSALIHDAPFGVFLIDAAFRVRQANKVAKVTFNIDPLIGRDLAERLQTIWQEPFATEAIHCFRHTLATGESYYSPTIVEPRADINEIQAYDWQIHRITLPDGSYGVVCYFYDLSEVKRAEAALQENEQLLRLALTGAQAGSWDWVLATGKLTWSPETYRLHGMEQTESLPQYEDWHNQILHPQDRDRVSNYVQQVIDQRQPDLQLEYRILHPQLGIRWQLSLGHLTVDEQGEPIRLSGITLDISDRKQAEQKITEQAALLDIASDAIFVCNLDQRISYWNQGAERLYGWKAAEAIGRLAYELLQTPLDRVSAIMALLLQQGEWQGEIHKITQSGKEVIVESRWTLVRDEAGQPKAILSVDIDITEKKQLEAQFYHAQRLESLGTLASGIAHDLNNALTPVLTIAQLLRLSETNLDEPFQEMLEVLEDSARRGANMVRQILTFTRGTGGERVPVEVAPLLQEVVKITRQTFPKSIEIREIIPAQEIRLVSANATQLHQVVMNLCVNARDAMLTGGILTVAVENFEANEIFAQMNLEAQVGQYVMITVADTGTGIPPAVCERIFDPFFTTKAPGYGTGLGLATVLGIVRSYGGFIQVASEVDRGTQFKVYLPAIETGVLPDLQESNLFTGQGELILVVDDEDPILQSTRAILETYQYQVLTADSGINAIAIYAAHQNEIAVVLLDMMMPDMDGLMVIRILQEMNPRIKLIAASGLLDNYWHSLEALGVTMRLNKPYTTEELLNCIHLQLRITN